MAEALPFKDYGICTGLIPTIHACLVYTANVSLSNLAPHRHITTTPCSQKRTLPALDKELPGAGEETQLGETTSIILTPQSGKLPARRILLWVFKLVFERHISKG